MDREKLEELLPAYLSGDLSAEEAARVEACLEESAEARDSLKAYQALESVLQMRREQVPPVDRFAKAALGRSSLRRTRFAMDAVFNVPVLTGAMLAIFGIVLFLYRNPITAWFEQKASLPDSTSLGLEWVSAAIAQFAGTDMWMLTAMYVAVTVLILLSTSLMLMRFLRG
jgi:anti-sigma factor RsiW